MPPLEVITESPPNAGVPISILTGVPLPQDQMYVRCNFDIPASPEHVEIVVPGKPIRHVEVDDLARLPQVETTVVMECAGNGRAFMDPQPEGTPWALGGVSPVTVRGVQLNLILGDLPADASEVVFTGADRGEVEPEGHINYQFSIDRKTAVSERPLLVTHIGGSPLTPEHGAPIRLVVPGQYAMKSVKWLTRIETSTNEFRGHFVNKYRYYDDTKEAHGAPVGAIEVRSLISKPSDGDQLAAGMTTVEGSAWSGHGPVIGVEVSVDEGSTWSSAAFEAPAVASAAVTWQAEANVTSRTRSIMARAVDALGNTQPLHARWNVNGYANNLAHRIRVKVV